jgi:hypothetical protein
MNLLESCTPVWSAWTCHINFTKLCPSVSSDWITSNLRQFFLYYNVTPFSLITSHQREQQNTGTCMDVRTLSLSTLIFHQNDRKKEPLKDVFNKTNFTDSITMKIFFGCWNTGHLSFAVCHNEGICCTFTCILSLSPSLIIAAAIMVFCMHAWTLYCKWNVSSKYTVLNQRKQYDLY